MPQPGTILLLCLVVVSAAACASTGWLPSLTLGMAGIRRGQAEADQRDRALELQADARLSWRLRLSSDARTELRTDARPNAGDAIDREARSCSTAVLCAWEERQRSFALRDAQQE
jgi:hypothetical protein